MGGRTVVSPTARGWRVRRRWRGQLPPDGAPLHALQHRRWLVEATCLGIPPERWVWQVTGWHASARVVEEVAAALARDDPSPQPGTAELLEHVTAAGSPFPVGHVRLVGSTQRPGGTLPVGGGTGRPPPAPPAPPTSTVRARGSAPPADQDLTVPGAAQAATTGPPRGWRPRRRPAAPGRSGPLAAGRWGHRHQAAPLGLASLRGGLGLGPLVYRSPRRRRVGPLTLVLVLALGGAASLALWPLAGPRQPVPARRAAPARPTPPPRGRRAAPTRPGRGAPSCPPPAPLHHGPVGGTGRRAAVAAVRHSPWVRYQLPASRRAGKTVALTFDDGPDPRFTPPILAILAHARAPATFFMVGSQAAAHPHLVRRVARAGQAVGGHTWHHARLDRLTWAGVAAEVDCTDRLLASLTGRPVRLVRPPGGSYDPGVVGLLAARGVQLTLWTVDSGDWTRPGVGRILATVARELRPGAIILLHDGGGDRSQTVAALPGVLRLLHARGYRAVALPMPPGRRGSP